LVVELSARLRNVESELHHERRLEEAERATEQRVVGSVVESLRHDVTGPVESGDGLATNDHADWVPVDVPWWRSVQKSHAVASGAAVPQYGSATGHAVAQIPDTLIDHSALDVIERGGQGAHWLHYNRLPSLPPHVEPLVMIARSTLHGVGVFARRFIDAGTVLFPYLSPYVLASARTTYDASAMRYTFGLHWDTELHFVVSDAAGRRFCVAHAARERGWGCVLNSARGTAYNTANCECVWPADNGGVSPWIRVTRTIPPLAELLLDYPFPELIAGS
jgi:hypothetical protein